MRKLIPVLLSSSLLVPGFSYSLGLGKIKVTSALNQPFSANIQLLGVRDNQLADIHAKLALQQDFERLGVEQPNVLNQLKFTVTKNKRGKAVIHVGTHERMLEPYLHFVMRLKGPEGDGFLRAYTVLLDPPNYMAVDRHPMVNPHKLRSTRATVTPPTVAQPKVKKAVVVAEKKKPQIISSVEPAQHYGPVKQHQSLWAIANEVRKGTTLNINQTMLAIAGANPQAFIGGNINRLKTGVTLNIPNVEQIRSVSRKQATREVRAHNRAWHQHAAIKHVINVPYYQPQQAKETAATEQPAHRLTLQHKSKKGVESSPVLQALSNSDSQLEKQLRADLAVSAEEASRVKETNQVLQEQFTLLQQQNQQLQQQLLQGQVELALLKKKLSQANPGMQQQADGMMENNLQTTMTIEQRPGVGGQGSDYNLLNNQQHNWSKLLYSLLAVFAGGGVLAGTVALRRRRSTVERAVPKTPIIRQPEPPIKPIAQEATKQEETRTTDTIAEVAGEDVIATKLDLATAYIRMNDHQGAADILHEIEHQGSEKQQLETRRLLQIVAENGDTTQ